MVGVALSTSTIPGPGAAQRPPGSSGIVAGLTLRGNPGQAVQVTSMQQFNALFGGQVPYGFLYPDASMFFGEGGTDIWVCRVVGASATAGNLSLNDSSTPTPQPTLELFAGCPNIDPVTGNSLGNVQDPGAWSTNLSVQVVASQLTGNFRVLVFYNGAQVESWGPFPTVAAAVAKINSTSAYLTAVNLNSNGNNPNPAVMGSPTALSAGNDQHGAVTATNISAAFNRVPASVAAGCWATTPGYDASLTGDAMLAWGAANNCDVGLSPTEGMNQSSVAAAAANFRGITGSQNGGYFWPWVLIPDGNGGTLVVPPDGFVAGRRSATIAATGGPWQPPAGNWGVAQYVVGLDPASGAVTDAVGDSLNGEQVNVIRPKNGIRLYGWRSLSTDTTNWELLQQSDILNNVAAQLATVEQQYAFSIIDSLDQLGSELRNAAKGVLQPYINAGALWPGPTGTNGQPTDPGYVLDTGADVNTPQSIAQNRFGIAVYIRPAGAAEVIPVSVIKVAIGNAF